MTSPSLVDNFSEDVATLAEHIRERVVEVHAGDRGIGSGTIWSVGPADTNGESDATIITNAHVVRATRGATITVRLADKRQLAATVVAIDPGRDLASLKVHASGLQPLEIGDSQALRVGELVLAVGNPFGRVGAVTAGVVEARAPIDPEVQVEPVEPAKPSDRSARGEAESAKTQFSQADHPEGEQQSAPLPKPTEAPAETPKPENERRPGQGRWQRPQIELIQADISLYPGNSGGPLVDALGRVVGINAMIGGGLAFAIPSRVVQHFLEEVQQVTQRVTLGVQVLTAPLNPRLRQSLGLTQEAAALITAVEEGSLAEATGLLVGDLLLAVDGYSIQDAQQLPRALSRSGAARGLTTTLLIVRGGERLELSYQPVVKAEAA